MQIWKGRANALDSDKKNIMVIPAFEPEPSLVHLAEEANDAGFLVVVVNDGSEPVYDETFRQAGEYAKVLTHEQNAGKGNALKTGFRWIDEQFGSSCTVVTMDADGQHLLEDALRVGSMAGIHKDALILGCRSKLPGEAPLRSRFGNTVTRMVYRMVTGGKVVDTQTGLRAFDGVYLKTMLAIEGNRYEYEMNVLLYFARENLPVMETEIAAIYQGKNETSHFHALRDSCLIYKEILKFSLSSFVGFIVDYIMYTILLFVTGASHVTAPAGLIVSNVGARVVSAAVNFMVNRKLVFQSRGNVFVSAMRYVLLAACILCCNTAVLHLLVNDFGANQYAAKIFVELFFFLVSWTVQHWFVFPKRKGQEEQKNGDIGKGGADHVF